VTTPVISPNGGTFKKKARVSISDATAGSTIYYTTDGSDPNNGSVQYIAPFTISGAGSHIVKAKAVASGYNDSDIGTAVFSIRK
jgi:chitinase